MALFLGGKKNIATTQVTYLDSLIRKLLGKSRTPNTLMSLFIRTHLILTAQLGCTAGCVMVARTSSTICFLDVADAGRFSREEVGEHSLVAFMTSCGVGCQCLIGDFWSGCHCVVLIRGEWALVLSGQLDDIDFWLVRFRLLLFLGYFSMLLISFLC